MSPIKESLQENQTLITNQELWEIPQSIVLNKFDRELPVYKNLVKKWLDDRPLLGKPYREHSTRLANRIKTRASRQVEIPILAVDESIELTASVFGQEAVEKQKSEFGDVLFFLLATDSAQFGLELDQVLPTHFRSIRESNIIPEKFQSQFLKYDSPAVITLQSAVSLVKRTYGSIDGYDFAQEYDYVDEDKDAVIPESDIAFAFALGTAFRYAMASNWNVPEIMRTTINKITDNYPIEFFNKWSPFAIHSDAIKCLQLFRNSYPNGFHQQYNNDLGKRFSQNTLWTIEPDGFVFRSHVHDVLDGIAMSSESTPKEKSLADNLLTQGNWGYQPIQTSASIIVINELATSPD